MSSPAPALDKPADGMDLLARVKTLVDRGELFDAAAVARAIPSDRPIKAVDVYHRGMCQPGFLRDVRTTRRAFTSWFHNMPSGRPHLPYHAIGPFGHDGITGDPAGSYMLMDEQFCSDLLNLAAERSALLRFSNLPGFSCLTMQQVSSVMRVTDDRATDGGGIYPYKPPAHREYGARVSISFGGSQCVDGFSAEQDQQWGTRYVNARRAFRQCTYVADRKFCAANPSFDWGDGRKLDLMAGSSAKECGGFGRYYREARSPKAGIGAGVDPAPGNGPCDGK